MKLYLVYEDVYEGFGCELRAYGIFTSKEKAEKAKDRLLEDYKRQLRKVRHPLGFDPVIIVEFESNEYVDEYLGGYEE